MSSSEFPEFADTEFGTCRHGVVFTKVREWAPGKKVQDVFLRRDNGEEVELLAGATSWTSAYHYGSGFLTGALDVVNSL